MSYTRYVGHFYCTNDFNLLNFLIKKSYYKWIMHTELYIVELLCVNSIFLLLMESVCHFFISMGGGAGRSVRWYCVDI